MNILFLGKPGSGKGTLTQKLIDDGFLQLATGDLLRTEESSGSELGREIGELLAKGKFATDDMIFFLVDSFLEKNNDKSIIFDGFPRNVAQAEICLERGIVFDKIFSLEVTDEKVKERIVNRRVHPQSGRVYNTVTMPPKVEGIDDITGEPLIHRKDDYLDVIDNRLQNFKELTEPIINLLESRGYFINKIDAEAPIDEQLQQVKDNITVVSHSKPKL